MASGIAGATFVIAVNGWMNNPTGFDLGSNGEVTNVRPLEALFNDHLWHELVHMYLAGFLVAGFLVAGVYAYAWLRLPRPLPPRGAHRAVGGGSGDRGADAAPGR